jgi:hypothetical protein
MRGMPNQCISQPGNFFTNQPAYSLIVKATLPEIVSVVSNHRQD